MKILVDSVEFLDFFPFEFECLVNFECEFGDLLHRIIENFELLIDHANVVFHLSDRINTRNELAVVFNVVFVLVVVLLHRPRGLLR